MQYIYIYAIYIYIYLVHLSTACGTMIMRYFSGCRCSCRPSISGISRFRCSSSKSIILYKTQHQTQGAQVPPQGVHGDRSKCTSRSRLQTSNICFTMTFTILHPKFSVEGYVRSVVASFWLLSRVDRHHKVISDAIRNGVYAQRLLVNVLLLTIPKRVPAMICHADVICFGASSPAPSFGRGHAANERWISEVPTSVVLGSCESEKHTCLTVSWIFPELDLQVQCHKWMICGLMSIFFETFGPMTKQVLNLVMVESWGTSGFQRHRRKSH